MQRYRFDLGYNGSSFFGWQIQPNQISVQETIEKALNKLYQINTSVVGCGRTDTGVHAKYYVLHVDLQENKYSEEELLYKLNKILPDSIALYSVSKVEPDFHARFHAVSRTYRYFVHLQKDPFLSDTSLLVLNQLDFEKMNESTTVLLGKNDFTSFSKLHTDVHTNICDLRKAEWVEYDTNKWYFEIEADRFLRNMVRATVGTLLEVGYGKLKKEDLVEILNKKDRSAAKTSVPAKALFLWNIRYY
jgi:tRNA pseudouridine38-40 synthase